MGLLAVVSGAGKSRMGTAMGQALKTIRDGLRAVNTVRHIPISQTGIKTNMPIHSAMNDLERKKDARKVCQKIIPTVPARCQYLQKQKEAKMEEQRKVKE